MSIGNSSVLGDMGEAPEVALARRAMRAPRVLRAQRILFGVGFPALLLAAWELSAWFGAIDQRFFPPPSRIASVAVETLSNPVQAARLGGDLLATLQRLSYGYVLGAVSGVVIGVLMALYRPVRYALGPIIYATFPTPKLAIFPLLIVIFGLGSASKTALVTLGVFYMTCINTLSGVLYANPIYHEVARAFKMPTLTRWFRVIVPSALPSIVTGLKLGVGQALILVVSAEFVSASDGIGYYIWNSWQVLDLPRMFVGLVMVCLVGGLAVAFGNILEAYLTPWAKR